MRDRPGRQVPERSDTLGAALGRALLRWLGLSGAVASASPGPPAPAVSPLPAAAVITPAAARPAVSRGAAVPSQATSQSPGAGLVEGLVANPRSLAAGFIAAEILGPPVSLRRP